ncbi:MAG: acylphosphatase [Candidatus Hydrogenedentes bacterium]|nr:acylphosphatase [Candidatus Hydrogenedentota bacterium]
MDSCVHVIVTGVVQGVCFRWFVEREANKLGITGWVRNRFDGSVELEAEGGKAGLEALIKMLRIGPRLSSVKGLNVEWLPYEGKFKSFDITF